MKEPEVKSFSQAVAPINSTGMILKIILTEEGRRALCRGFLPSPLGRILGKKPKKKERETEWWARRQERGFSWAWARHQSLVVALRHVHCAGHRPQPAAGHLWAAGGRFCSH